MKIIPVVKRVRMKDNDEAYEDMLFWLSRTPQERIAAVTQLRSAFIKEGERMDKTVVIRKKMH